MLKEIEKLLIKMIKYEIWNNSAQVVKNKIDIFLLQKKRILCQEKEEDPAKPTSKRQVVKKK